MQYHLQQGKGPSSQVVVAGFASSSSSSSLPKWENERNFPIHEPISVLDTRRSPSPSTSSSFGGGSVLQETHPTEPAGAGAGGSRKEEWMTELQPLQAGLEMLPSSGGGMDKFRLNLEDWESLVAESGQDQSLLRWISGDVDDPTSFNLKQLLQPPSSNNMVDQTFSFGSIPSDLSTVGGGSCSGISSNGTKIVSNPPNNPSSGNFGSHNTIFSNSNDLLLQQFEGSKGKPQIFNPQVPMNNQQHLLQPQPKRQNLGFVDPAIQFQTPKVSFHDLGNELSVRKQQTHMQFPPNNLQQKPLMAPKQEGSAAAVAGKAQSIHYQYQHQQQVLYDQLYKASELILAGNFSHAQGILARLNHQLTPVGKPFQRAAFYFKEALQLPLLTTAPSSKTPTPFDGMFKMGAYKAFSEVSPLLQFMNFTANQSLLEAIHDSQCIHIVDFDIGFGAQWSSFMQELSGCNRGNLSLKITAFASPSTHHPLEIALMHENLTQFATDIGVKFELEVVNFDSFDPNSYSIQASQNEAIVVNFPIWSCSSQLPALPSILCFIKQLSPRIVVSLDHGYERTDLPFSHHILHALQYYEVLLDSIDTANVTLDAANRIEKFLLLPRIESIVLGRLASPAKLAHWKTLFDAAGFSPVAFSNFNESQADCVVKRTPCQGFHMEKRQASLVLCWQRRELVSVSAWRC